MENFVTRTGFYRPVTACRGGQDVFDAAREKFGENARVNTSRNACWFMPEHPELTVGEVVVRPGESFWVEAVPGRDV